MEDQETKLVDSQDNSANKKTDVDPLAEVIENESVEAEKAEKEANTEKAKPVGVQPAKGGEKSKSDPVVVKKSKEYSQREFADAILELERNKSNECNAKGDLKYTPRGATGKLSRYDDFQRDPDTNKTRFEREFIKLVKQDRLVDVDLTKKFLRMYGHRV